MNPHNAALPTLPDPVDAAPAADAEPIEIERIDDTPEQDRGQAPPPPETYQAVDDEKADEAYGQKVQGRIKQLRHVYHEERRQKEAAFREREQLVAYAQNLQSEVARLRDLVSSGERVLIDQASGRAAAEVENAKEQFRRAHDSGSVEDIAKAQEALARAVAEHERFKSMRPASPPQQQQQPQQPQQQYQPQQQAYPPPPLPQQPAAPARDERYEAWKAKHPWHRTAGYEEATGYLDFIHTQLVSNGVLPSGPTADTYWATVDQRLSATFPQLAGSGSGNATHANGQAPNGRSSEQTRQNRPPTATSGNRPSSAPTKVRLTESQLRIARRLGVAPEDYAREFLKSERARG